MNTHIFFGYIDKEYFPLSTPKQMHTQFENWVRNPVNIGTNNPYFLTFLNNCLLNDNKGVPFDSTLPRISFDDITAVYIQEDNSTIDLKDYTDGMVSGNWIDTLSEDYSKSFHKLLNLKYLDYD